MLRHRALFPFTAGPVAMLGTLLALPAAPGLAEPADFGLGFEPRSFPSRANPPLPDPGTFPIQLVHDDGMAEGVFGFAGNTARQFLWLNRFTSPGPFRLDEIWVLFPAGMDVPVGGAVQLVVYRDPDGDPSTGAALVASYDEVVQVADGSTFSVYPLDPQPTFSGGGGEILIGVVNRFFNTGVDPPPTQPAALDDTVSQDRSYFALWAGDPPDPPDLATATVVDVLDGTISGNFLIRGFGTRSQLIDVPALGGAGLALLAALLGLAGAGLVRRRSGRSR